MARLLTVSAVLLSVACLDAAPVEGDAQVAQVAPAVDAETPVSETPVPETPPAEALRFDPEPAWPLCGRIAEDPDYADGTDCPAERGASDDGAVFDDFPLSSTFGPRRQNSQGGRYDFHRGIDIPTECGTPVFAITRGIVKTAGASEAYSDLVVVVRHAGNPYADDPYDPADECTAAGGCANSVYMHLSEIAPGVELDTYVEKGQYLGRTGYSDIGQGAGGSEAKCSPPHQGFEHLHFEIRQAPADDAYSRAQRDAIHPLAVLPFRGSGGFPGVDIRPVHGDEVTVRVEVDREDLDVRAVELEVFGEDVEGQLIPVAQHGQWTPEGYELGAPRFDVDAWNFQWSHKDSGSVPWTAFDEPAQAFTCPFRAYHEQVAVLPDGGYSPHYHLEPAHLDANGDPLPANELAGLTSHRFNGVRIDVGPFGYGAGTPSLRWEVTFEALELPAGEYCLRAAVTDVRGEETEQWVCGSR